MRVLTRASAWATCLQGNLGFPGDGLRRRAVAPVLLIAAAIGLAVMCGGMWDGPA
jgi:hypothetical protein